MASKDDQRQVTFPKSISYNVLLQYPKELPTDLHTLLT